MKKGKKKNNTFKFKNFAERISEINVNVYQSLATKTHEVPENDKDTFFRETLEKWAELNCTLDFTAFYQEIRKYVQSFNQLVYHKETVVGILKKYLSLAESLALEPCLDLLAQLSRDLLHDFQPYFQDFFNIIFLLLKDKDTVLIENAFTCLAHVFKFTWKFIVRDLENTFNVYKPLFTNEQKPHIHAFAAESFAFLIRKSKQKHDVIVFLFQQLVKDPKITNGLGLLLFHSIKGVKSQFTFNAPEILKYTLEMTKKFSTQLELVLAVLINLWNPALKHTSVEHSQLLFDSVCDFIDENPDSTDVLYSMGIILDMCVQFHNGKLLSDQKRLYDALFSVASSSNAKHITKAVSSLLMLHKIAISNEQCKSLIDIVLCNKCINLLEKFQFSKSLFSWTNFNSVLKTSVLKLINSELSQTGKELGKTKSLCFDFIIDMVFQDKSQFYKPFSTQVEKKILEFDSVNIVKSGIFGLLVEDISAPKWDGNSESLWMAAAILDNLRLSDNERNILVTKLNVLISHFFKIQHNQITDDQLFTFSFLLKTYIGLVKSLDEVCNTVTYNDMFDLIRSFPQNQNVLKAFEIYCRNLSVDNSKVFTKENMFDLYSVLKKNFSSPYHLTRLISLMVFNSFHVQIELNEDTCNIFQLCIHVENIPVSLETYRERLMALQKLHYNPNIDVPTFYHETLIRYLIGNLFLNLYVMWEPTAVAISTYAVEKQANIFWAIWRVELYEVSQICAFKTADQKLNNSTCDSILFCKYFDLMYHAALKERTDYNNFRILLWNGMMKFPELAERKSRDVVPLFFEFLKNEYSGQEEMMARKVDIRHNDALPVQEHGAKDLAKRKTTRKTKIKTLCAKLKLFSIFKNPKALSKEQELFQFYMELLTNKDNEIQTLALKCLMTYKFHYLIPYKENFNKLMTDASFRDELTLFSGESATLLDTHKKDLMPILIRLLYGKLQRKSGLGISGKSSLTTRRNVVMQFLANCSDEEIQTFFHLILQPFKDDGELKVELVFETFDLSSIIPLRKQTGFLNMLSNIISRLRKLITPFEHQLFRVLLKIIWTCSMALKQKNQVSVTFHGRLKDARHLGLTKLVEYFEAMNTFHYHYYIEDIFTASVWPQIEQLTTDAVQNVTPLFRLFICWSKHSRYNQLLVKHNAQGISPSSVIFEVLQHPSLSTNVEKEIMLLTLQLLTVADYKGDEKSGEIISVAECIVKDSETIGVTILKPHIPTIISVISRKLLAKLDSMNCKTKQKIGHIIPTIQLSVLAEISRFVTDEAQCSLLVQTLFPLLQCIASEETQIHVITTIRNLLKYVSKTDHYLPLVPCLFFMFAARKARQILCEVYRELTHSHKTLQTISAILQKLNAWDLKRLDEPDYDRRLEGYRDVNSMLQDGELVDCEQVLPILHHCLHIIMTTEDMSLRDASSSCIEKIIKLAVDNEEIMFNEIVNKAIVPAIKTGLKMKKQATRMEFINLLALVVRMSNSNVFADMKVLLSADPEKDFFENIKHIQVHRRIRALHRLSKLCEENILTVPHLFTFFMPLISHVIFDKLSTTKDHNLLSETISTIGIVMKSLPWSKYLHILRNYLNLMQKDHQNQKTIIRVVVAILNNFHFNVSNVKSPSKPKKTKDKQPEVIHVDGNDDGENYEDEMDNGDKEQTAEEKILSDAKELRIQDILNNKILPQLKRFLNKKSRVDSFHKLSHNKEEDDEEVMKVPMALAMVKLLQHLPKETLHSHLPGLILRISQALRSHARDVREVARDTLKKICLSLGAAYFPIVLKEMRSVLLRGYQLHVLGYTVHSLLDAMKDTLQPGDMDACVDPLMEVVTEELFGEVSEEKDVSGITGKLMEAKSRKANDAIEIFSKFVSGGCISKLITPLKEVLDTTLSKKTSRKIEEALRRVSVGLQHSKGLAMNDLLLFTHGLVSCNLQAMLNHSHNREKQLKSHDDGHSEKDIFLVPSLPVRGGKTPDISKETNEYILVEFGLQLLHTFLKRQRLSPSDNTHVSMLDPFVGLVISGMSSKYNKVVVLSMRCLSFLIKFPLSSMKDSVPTLAKQLFKILKKYAKAGAGKGENFELVMTSFKAMTVFIRDYKDMQVTNKQLRLLLAFVEEDIYNSSRQSTALPLLKAILSRRLTVAEVHDVMKKIADLSVRDSDEVTRLHCRQLMLQYLLDYPLGKKISAHLDFYTSHLSYEDEVGRLSSLDFISSTLTQFPERLVRDYSGYFFVPLVMMLANDESAKCRKQAAATVKVLVKSLDGHGRNDLFEIALTWSKQEKVLLKLVSLQVFGMFAEVEEKLFQKRLEVVMPIINEVLQEHWEQDVDSEDEEDKIDGSDINKDTKEVSIKDRLLYNTVTCFGKLCVNPDLLIFNEKYEEVLKETWGFAKELLLHSHAWIRLAASQLFGLYFGAVSPNQLVEMSNSPSQQYLAVNTVDKVKELCSNFFSQMKDENLTGKIADQATKNLIYLSKVVKLIDPYFKKLTDENANENDEEETKIEKVVSFKTLILQMGQLAAYEASHSPKQTLKRTCVFRWTAALCLDLSEDECGMYLANLLRPIHREITTSNDTESELYKLSQEVLDLIRGTVNKDCFAEQYAKLQKKVLQVKESRKRKAAEGAVADPLKHALRKQKTNLAKREQRKRKLYEKKPSLKFKKIRSKEEI